MFRLPKTAIPGAAFPAVPATAAATMLAVVHQLEAAERAGAALLDELQITQIQHLASHAARVVPHYRDDPAYAALRSDARLEARTWNQIPVLTRTTVQTAGERLHASSLPAGHGSIATATTSGSSGRPVTIRKTALAQFYWQCGVLREQQWQARDFTAHWMTVLRDDTRSSAVDSSALRPLPHWGEPLAAVYPTGPASLLDYRLGVPAMLRTIVRENPAYLTTFPSLLRELLRESAATGLRPEGLREVRCTGEALAEEVRSWCSELWGARVTEIYSAAEIGIIAIPCAEQNALHVQSEMVRVEVLRDDGSPCEIGEQGRVVLTPLHNFAMPLLRYEIGDRAAFGPPCKCGRALPVLACIPGRARDMLTLPNGERRFPYYGHGEIMRVAAITQHQVAQTGPAEIELRLVVRRPLTDAEEAHILAAARAGIGPDHAIRLVYRDEIRRHENGKFAEFINETEPPDAASVR